MFKNGTHFNPVDLVCGTKDFKGRPFNLINYVDKNTGFISLKSKNGKELKSFRVARTMEWSNERLEYDLR